MASDDCSQCNGTGRCRHCSGTGSFGYPGFGSEDERGDCNVCDGGNVDMGCDGVCDSGLVFDVFALCNNNHSLQGAIDYIRR